MSMIYRNVVLAFSLMGIAVLIWGCEGEGTGAQRKESSVKAAAPSSVAIRGNEPDKDTMPDKRRLYKLPGMEGWVNGHIRVKVVPKRDIGLTSGPSGLPNGRTALTFHPYFVCERIPETDEPEYLLLSSSPKKASAMGWCRASDVQVWNTRIVARLNMPEYLKGNRMKPEVLIFSSYEDLVKHNNGELSEPIAKVALTDDFKFFPWPVLDSKFLNVNTKRAEAFNVAFMGSISEGSTLIGSSDDSPVQRTQEEAKMDDYKEGSRMLTVTLVIDTTFSTEPYDDDIRDGILKIARGLIDNGFKPDLRFRIVEYRDYIPAIMFDGNKVTRSHGYYTNYIDLAKALDGISLAEGSSYDWPEAMYEGMKEGIEGTEWRHKIGSRVIILIGDNSGHEPGDLVGEGGNRVETPLKLTMQDMADMANERHIKIFSMLVPNRVCTKQNAYNEYEKSLHRKQFSFLAESTGGKMYELGKSSMVADGIISVLGSESRFTETKATFVDESIKGTDEKSIRGIIGDENWTTVVQFLKDVGAYGDLNPGKPRFSTGWVCSEAGGIKVLDREVYTCKAELHFLLAHLNDLVPRLSDEDLMYIYRQTLLHRTGDEDMSTKLEESYFNHNNPDSMDIFLMALGVPCHPNSMLNLTSKDLFSMDEDAKNELRRKLQQKIAEITDEMDDVQRFPFDDVFAFGFIRERKLP